MFLYGLARFNDECPQILLGDAPKVLYLANVEETCVSEKLCSQKLILRGIEHPALHDGRDLVEIFNLRGVSRVENIYAVEVLRRLRVDEGMV